MENVTDTTTPARPLGFWLRTVDGLLAREFATAFETEGISRRDWRILNVLGGDVVSPDLSARLERGGGKKLRRLIERGWVAGEPGAWTLTDEGRTARERLGESVAGIRSRIAGAVSDEDFATTLASLEAIARELGWNPEERLPRGHGRGFGRRGFGPPGFDHGHGRPGFGHGRPGFGPHGERAGESASHGHCEHGHRGHGHGPHRHAEHAFERGFDAGFSRGAASRDA
ncbi:MarR family winged helix-turn-helix transcriptional regulator [Microbacterium aurum]